MCRAAGHDGGTRVRCIPVLHEVLCSFQIKLQIKMVVAFLLIIPFLALMFRYSAEEIEEKVNSFRMMLQEKQEPAVNTNEKPT